MSASARPCPRRQGRRGLSDVLLCRRDSLVTARHENQSEKLVSGLKFFCAVLIDHGRPCNYLAGSAFAACSARTALRDNFTRFWSSTAMTLTWIRSPSEQISETDFT